MGNSHYDVYYHPAFAENNRLFLDKYEFFNFVFLGDERYAKRKLNAYSSRTCRFCRHSYPETAFAKLSHLLPKLIGNTNMYSDFECDKCNAFFSGIENDLAAYLGISRSIVGLNGEKGTPGFTARRMKAKSRSFIGENILIIAPDEVKIEGYRTTLAYTKNGYTPANVYKALLKSALSLLDDVDIKEYQSTIDFLMGESIIKAGAMLGGYQLSFNLNMPLHVLCYRKKRKKDQFPEFVMCFHFQNSILVFPFPPDDNGPLDNKGSCEWNLIMPPPYFINKEMMQNAMPVAFLRDFSSNTEVLDEEEIITFQLDPKDIENIWSYDPATDKFEQKQYNPAGLKYLVLTKNGVKVDPKALSAFIKEQMEGK